ncbi:MAG: HD domain-containing protein [Candidatus Rokubacteria bacterium]|nr:HD domain-containing protein [Candidatus Rokubacteria bacterium]
MTATAADSSPGVPALTHRFEQALIYACHVHGGQTRKETTIPYIGHLLSVASLVIEDGGDEDEAIAALLHDAVEDQGGKPRLDDIRTRFGEKVARIVKGCTDADTVPKPEWLPRKQGYIRHLRTAPPEVLRVSCADKLHNARAILADYRTLEDALFTRFTGGKAGTLWYYACLVNVFRERRPGGLAEELERVVRELRRLAAPTLTWPASEEESPTSARAL